MTVVIKNHNKTPLMVPRAVRRMIDARLKKALEEVSQGKTAGPFNTADEMISSLKRKLKPSGTKNKPRSR